MKRLFEEFKNYENLWEAVEEVPATKGEELDKEFELSASWERAWDTCPSTFELEYDGFIEDWAQDSWDPESPYGYTTISRTTEYDDYTYEITDEQLLDSLKYILDKKRLTPAKIDKVIKELTRPYKFSSYTEVIEKAKKLIADYQKLAAICEQDESLSEKPEIFIIDHMEDFFFVFNEDIKEYFEGDAEYYMRSH